MLELVFDNRSGNKLEIVIPTFNEEKRIGNILEYCGKDFDIVLLDDSSSDKTVDLALKAGATVFKRTRKTIGEEHFVYYTNDLTKSCYCFYMFADEFVKKQDLYIAFKHLQNKNSVIMGKRVDWVYGKRINSIGGIQPRGFRKGSAQYDSLQTHSSLKYIKEDGEKIDKIIIDVYHLAVYSMKNYFCRAGEYIALEVEQFRKSKNPFQRFFKRYFLYEIVLLPVRMWKERDKGIYYICSMFCMSFTITFMGILNWIEQKYFISPDEQLKQYNNIYLNEIKKDNEK